MNETVKLTNIVSKKDNLNELEVAHLMSKILSEIVLNLKKWVPLAVEYSCSGHADLL